MIGQAKFIQNVDTMISNGKFPRFTILVGLPGSGKRTAAEYIAKKLGAGLVTYSCGVDDMRAMIGNAHKITSTQVFLIPDADNMSPAAKNCILKVTEEPPQNAHFIMTVTDTSNVLETIKSRGTILNMDKYSADEIVMFIKACVTKDVTSNTLAVLSNVCETPGDVLKVLDYNPEEFSEYVEKVTDNLEVVSVANMFKIANKVKLKETQEGYDLRLFWRMFVNICIDRLRTNVLLYGNWVRVTTKKLGALQITGANKSALFDSWLIDIKEVT